MKKFIFPILGAINFRGSIIVKLIIAIVVSQIIAPIISGYILKLLSLGGLTNTTYAVLVSTVVNLFVVTSLIVLLAIKMIIKPLQEVLSVTLLVSQGDLTKTTNLKNNDEIGKLSQAINVMIENLRSMIEHVKTVSKELHNQNIEIKNLVEQIKEQTEHVASTMQEIATGSEEQANSSSDVANSIVDLNELIEQASKGSKDLEESSKIVFDTSHNGSEQMNKSIAQIQIINEIVSDSVTKVSGLEKSTHEISKLVDVIQSIAQQTNLLALNAAIESARAGEAGRGFAVVAEEVRKLAEQTSVSVTEITNIVANLQNESRLVSNTLEGAYSQVEKGTDLISDTGESLESITSEINKMVMRIEKVTASLANIKTSNEKISTSIQQVAAIAEETSAGIEETAASTEKQNALVENISESAASLTESCLAWSKETVSLTVWRSLGYVESKRWKGRNKSIKRSLGY